jgi:hypothetical protein
MAQQFVNTGTTANDGTGDTLRIAAQKINQNFTEVYNLLGSTVQQSADWNATTGVTQILNKPAIFSGSYVDLTNQPTLATVALTGQYNDLIAKPNLAPVASSGNYNDLSNKPNLFSGNYTDLVNRPTIPSVSAVGISGSYADLENKPTIPNNTNQLINGNNFITASSLTWNNITGKPTTVGLVAPPTYSYGSPGDTAGLLALDSNYLYYCSQNYVNNLTPIWHRISVTGTTW